MGEPSAGVAVAIGVLVGLVSTTVQSIGLTLQRKSHLLEDEKEDEYARRPPHRRRRWQLGMLMFLIANIVGSTVQITTLPLPVLSTLQASGLVFNTICATIILHEPFTRYSLLGTVLVAGGAVLIGLFGAMTEPSHGLQQLLDLLARRNFLIWLVGTFFFAVAFSLLAWFSHRLLHRAHPRMRLMQGMAYGAVSGILSAHTLLVAKSAVELLVRTIVDRHNQFNRWQSWIILLALLVLALSQLYYLHLGLKLCSTSVLYPFVFCIYNIIAILDGLIYFHQTSRLPTLHAGLIALGTVVLLAGVVALSWRLDEGHAYEPVAIDESGRARRVRSMSRIATPTLPQTVLAPGMGIVEGTPTSLDPDEDEDDDGRIGSTAGVNPDDEESALDAKRRRRESADAHETTPLIRPATTPNLASRSPRSPLSERKQPGSGSASDVRAAKLRRTTVTAPGEAKELWDELVESDGYRRRSMDFGTMTQSLNAAAGAPPNSRTPSWRSAAAKSPSSVRWRDRPGSSASGARAKRANGSLATAHHGRSVSGGSGSGSGILTPRRWRFWEPPTPKSKAPKSPAAAAAAEEAEAGDTDGSEDEPPPPVAASSSGRSRPDGEDPPGRPRREEEQGPAEWFRLRWWRSRWRSRDQLLQDRAAPGR